MTGYICPQFINKIWKTIILKRVVVVLVSHEAESKILCFTRVRMSHTINLYSVYIRKIECITRNYHYVALVM